MATKTEKDACDLLDSQHKEVKKLFNSYDELAGSKARGAVAKRKEIATEICHKLTAHAQIEEEIFYPALRAVIKETDMLAEAEVEHQGAKDLIAQIEGMGEPDEMYDAKVKVLGEYIDHHVKEERNEIFPKARANRKLDLITMRDQLQARFDELLAEIEATA